MEPQDPLALELRRLAAEASQALWAYLGTFRRSSWRQLWSSGADPERLKLLARIAEQLEDLQRFLCLPNSCPAVSLADHHERIATLIQTITPEVDLYTATEVWNALKIELFWAGPDDYIMTVLDGEQDWHLEEARGLLTPDRQRQLEEVGERYRGGEIDNATRTRTIEYLSALVRDYGEMLRTERARIDHRTRYLVRLAPWVWGLALTLGAVIVVTEPDTWRSVVSAGVAGSLGATLSGVLRTRSAVTGAEMRQQNVALVAQPAVGAALGLIVFLVLYSDVVTIAGLRAEAEDWATFATFGTLAGLSEPFAFSLLERAAAIPPDKAPEERR